MTKEEIIERRKKWLNYEEAIDLQNQLAEIYKKEYKPQHTAEEYLSLILDHGVSTIEKKHPQDENFNRSGMIYTCFSVVSQHVDGITKEHCLDQVYDAVQRRRQRVEYYKTLPTFEELIESDTPINPAEKYDTRITSEEDGCATYSGNEIIRIRRIGLAQYRKENAQAFFKWLYPDGKIPPLLC